MNRSLAALIGAAVCVYAADQPWDHYNLSPTSRILSVPGFLPITLTTSAPSFLFDFKKDIGGDVSITLGATVAAGASLGLAFSESIYYTQTSDASNGGSGADGTLTLTDALTPGAVITTPRDKLRGGFRYLRVFLVNPAPSTSVVLANVTVLFSPAPTMANPSLYINHFFSSDDLVNRVWYAGAYTVQLDTIDPAMGRIWPPPASGWDNSANAGIGSTILVDGAKRDRMVWGGDAGVSIPTAYVSTGDILSAANSIATLYGCQNKASGIISMVGPPICDFDSSDTYHLWALIGTCTVFQYTQNATWLAQYWPKFVLGLNVSAQKIGANGLMVVNLPSDWARCCQGGENVAANALLFRALSCGSELAQVMQAPALSAAWSSEAATVQSAANSPLLWDDTVGAFLDNPTSSMHPQDGNALAVWYGLVQPASRAVRVSNYLAGNWGQFGSRTPEWNMDIGTFPGSMEVLAHMTAQQPSRALALIRLQWGYMLDSPNSTNSSFWEGFHADGTFAYKGDYMSNAHGWATGPVSALSAYVVGMSQTSVVGRAWAVKPQPGDLSFAQGSLLLDGAQGFLSVAWSRDNATEAFSLSVDASGLLYDATAIGVIGIPVININTTVVTVNNVIAWSGGAFKGGIANITSADSDGIYVYFRGVRPASFALYAEN